MNIIQSPKSILLQRDTCPNLIVKGQGVFLFSVEGSTCSFNIMNHDRSNGLRIDMSSDGVHVTGILSLEPLIDPSNTTGITTNRGAYYWFSLDYNNQILITGIGEVRVENAIYQYKFPTDNRVFLESLTTITEQSSSIRPLRLLRDPVTNIIPLLVKDTHELTMKYIAEAKYMPRANLSPIAQTLYACIAGPHFVLDDAEFPNFSKAIEASIADPSGWCHNRLIAKANEFGPGKPLETYLRITLNQNNGESPGIPYVMEIWPPGHYSPVHNHAGSNAIIRVLHGSINVSLFPYLSPDVKPFSIATFKKDDITWISPTLNQTHQLLNKETKHTCVTIQCYMYDEKDRQH
ncbi:MAG: hypothetical protein EB127_26390, partial [Alphaproteobacteria bacterium]|nr:hypothetical protein [Alphaproteobacteria bacterium]